MERSTMFHVKLFVITRLGRSPSMSQYYPIKNIPTKPYSTRGQPVSMGWGAFVQPRRRTRPRALPRLPSRNHRCRLRQPPKQLEARFGIGDAGDGWTVTGSLCGKGLLWFTKVFWDDNGIIINHQP